MGHGREEGRAIHHGGVNHLTHTRSLPLQQTTNDSEGQQHASTSEVGQEV